MMKKNVWLVAGIAGMLLGAPLADAQAKSAHTGNESGAGYSREHHHPQRHLHKKSPKHFVASHRNHDVKPRHHDSHNDKGIKN
jgi:hypothetical protein